MRLIMACSEDGYLCTGPDDPMDWTGEMDKSIFRILTGVGGVCAIGGNTWKLMPTLDGRQVIPLSREGYTLGCFNAEHPDGWLMGGPTVAKAAFTIGLVREFHLCRISLMLRDGVHMSDMCRGFKTCDFPGDYIRPTMETRFHSTDTKRNVTVELYRLGP